MINFVLVKSICVNNYNRSICNKLYTSLFIILEHKFDEKLNKKRDYNIIKLFRKYLAIKNYIMEKNCCKLTYRLKTIVNRFNSCYQT